MSDHDMPQHGFTLASQDGPNTHKYTTANHITSWTLIPLHDPVTAIKHYYHVPTVVVEEIERAALVRTPETLDVERLASVMEAMVHGTRHMTLAVGSTWQTVAAGIAAEYLAVTLRTPKPEGEPA